MKGVDKDVVKYFNDSLFSVRISGGAETILHSSNGLLSQ